MFPVRVEGDDVYLELPPEKELERRARDPEAVRRCLCVNDPISTSGLRSLESMNLRDFRRAGHSPTLVSAFLYFDVSFMVWLLPGALANSIVPEFGLSDSQKGLMVAVPLLGGAVLAAGAGAPDRPHRVRGGPASWGCR